MSRSRSRSRSLSRSGRPRLGITAVLVALSATFIGGVAMAPPSSAADPDLGPNVVVFDPSMPIDQIQARVDAVAAQQVNNEMGTQRYALLFKPGTYGTTAR